MNEKLIKKKDEIKKIEEKIKKLSAKKAKLTKEIELLEMRENINNYKALEVRLSQTGMTLEELLQTLK